MVHPELIYSTTKSAVELFLSFPRNRATIRDLQEAAATIRLKTQTINTATIGEINAGLSHL